MHGHERTQRTIVRDEVAKFPRPADQHGRGNSQVTGSMRRLTGTVPVCDNLWHLARLPRAGARGEGDSERPVDNVNSQCRLGFGPGGAAGRTAPKAFRVTLSSDLLRPTPTTPAYSGPLRPTVDTGCQASTPTGARWIDWTGGEGACDKASEESGVAARIRPSWFSVAAGVSPILWLPVGRLQWPDIPKGGL